MWSAWFFFFTTLISGSEGKDDQASLLPLPSERIQEIKLNKKCENVELVEWQDDQPTEEKIKIINEICNLAVEKLPIFLKKKGITTSKNLKLDVSVSILNRGKNPRQLNDSKRFASLNLPKRGDGTPRTIYGYYHYNTRFIFALNEIIVNKKPNKLFKMILAHEIFHALTHQNNLIEKFPYPESDSDESFSREFTSFLGLGE